jgi:hypothetical protein
MVFVTEEVMLLPMPVAFPAVVVTTVTIVVPFGSVMSVTFTLDALMPN